MAGFKTHNYNSSQSQFTNSEVTFYNDEGLSIIGLRLSDIDKDQTINFKHNGKFISVRKKLEWARKTLEEQSPIITTNNIFTYFDVRAGEPTGEGSGGGGVSTLKGVSRMEINNDLSVGNNFLSFVENELCYADNDQAGEIQSVRLLRIAGSHTNNTITIKRKLITSPVNVNDQTVATFNTTNQSTTNLTATVTNDTLPVDSHFYVVAENQNTNLQAVIIINYTY